MERAQREGERQDRAGDDHPETERPHGCARRLQRSVERDRRSELVEGKAPPRLEHGPEDGRHPEREAGEREGVASRRLVLPREVVGGERAGREQPCHDADGVQAEVPPHLRHSHQADEREGQRRPHPPAHRLVPHEPGPERHEHGGRELEQEADADRQPLDRDEVEPLHEREPDDAVEDQQRQLVTGDPEAPRGGDRQHRGEPEERARGAELGQPHARDAALGEDHLGHRPVHREQGGGGGDHRVPEPRVRSPGRSRAVEDDLRHGGRLVTPMLRAGGLTA